MAMYKVDKGIPLPKPQYSGKRTRYPFEIMEVGDSFFAPQDVLRQTLDSGIQQAQRKLGFKFALRRVKGGHRIWRVA